MTKKPMPPTFVLPLRPLAGARQQPKGLAALVMKNWVLPWLRSRIKYAPRTSHTNPLGHLEHHAAGVKGAALELPLGKGSGEDRLSELAGAHWLELALSSLAESRKDFPKWFEAFGYRLDVAPTASLLKKTALPLVEVRHDGKTWLVAARKKAVVSDVDAGPPSYASLDAADRRLVDAAAKKGLCGCQVCASLRKPKR